jgi:hypothetical protein
MAFHTNAKRPASGNVWERLRERGAQSARSRPRPGGEGTIPDLEMLESFGII